MSIKLILDGISKNAGTLAEAGSSKNPQVIASMLGPAARGFLLRQGKRGDSAAMRTSHHAFFDWIYERDQPKLAALYSAAKQSQWDAESTLDWSISVDPLDPDHQIVSEELVPLRAIPAYRGLPEPLKARQRYSFLSWMLSQFLHGEQGALFAACQVTEAVQWMDGKLYGSTQVVDEGRHVEVFHRYLTQKLEKLYQINDNLYVIIDALMTDARWDLKFLGMQILIEGLALAAFGTLRNATREPLLRDLLKYVITDEARHVHFGVVSLSTYYSQEISERERREREDWAYEMSLLMRSRFLAHEFYDEYYGHILSRRAWDKLILESEFMSRFRTNMFRRIIPNLKRIGLLSDRIRPHYQAIGLLSFEDEKAAPELTPDDLLEAA
jgi:hypothetical protein